MSVRDGCKRSNSYGHILLRRSEWTLLKDDIEGDVWRQAQDHGVEDSREASEDSMVRVACSHGHHANHLIDGGHRSGLGTVHTHHRPHLGSRTRSSMVGVSAI